MNHWLSTFTPGLLLAVAPALVTIAYLAVQGSRRQRATDRSERIRAVLDFTSQSWAVSLMLPFTQAHAEAATKLIAPAAVLMGQLQTFDLKHMSDHYTGTFTDLLRAASQVKATESAAISDMVDDVLAATNELFAIYLIPDDKRPKLARVFAQRPPLNKTGAHQAIKNQADAIRRLEAAAAQPEGRRGPPRWL